MRVVIRGARGGDEERLADLVVGWLGLEVIDRFYLDPFVEEQLVYLKRVGASS